MGMKEAGSAVLGGVLGLGTMLLFIVVFLLVNGGYVYRTDCARAGGTTEREWTYSWNGLFPYIGYSRSGCDTHSGTRVALDAVGLWKIDGDGSGEAPDEDHSAEYSPGQIDAGVDGCVGTGRTRSFCECAFAELTARISPAEFNAAANAISSGDEAYADLPESLRKKVRDADVAAERDCRD